MSSEHSKTIAADTVSESCSRVPKTVDVAKNRSQKDIRSFFRCTTSSDALPESSTYMYSSSTAVSEGLKQSSLVSAPNTLSTTQNEVPCSLSCCSGDQPFQPSDKELLKETSRTQTGRSRSVNPQWFVTYPWLTLCMTTGKVLCCVCREQEKKGRLTFSSKQDPAFIRHGFNNWKKAVAKFSDHEKSQTHREAASKALSVAQGTSVVTQISAQATAEAKTRRLCLQKEVETLIFLLRQNIPIRGKIEEEGNFMQLLKVRSGDVPELKHVSRYLSPSIQNEIIRTIGLTLLRALLQDIRKAGFYAIMADETFDLSKKEQLTLCIRWVDESLHVYEDPVELIEVDNTSGENLAAVLKDALLRMMLPIEKCRGQAYDGAANMQGMVKGVAARIIQDSPSAIHVHCLAHCLNLVLQDASRGCRSIRNALDLTGELTSFIRNSPKVASELRAVAENCDSKQKTSMRPLCPTRWTCRTASIKSVLDNYSSIMTALEHVSCSSNGEHGRRASGMLALMEQFSTLFGLILSAQVFGVAEELSRSLQSAHVTAQEAFSAAELTKTAFDEMRKDESFERFFSSVREKAASECQSRISEPVLPRRRKLPKKLAGDCEEQQDPDPKAFYRRQYFEVLDVVRTQLVERFNQPSFKKVRDVEKLIEDSASGKPINIPDTVQTLYSGDIDFSRLNIQLQMLPEICGKHKKLTATQVVTSVRAAMTTGGTVFSKMMSEVILILRLYLTLPVTSATAERTFSVLRRTKSFLRTTMSQSRLNAAMLCSVHKQRTDELDVQAIVQEFCDANDRRRLFFSYSD